MNRRRFLLTAVAGVVGAPFLVHAEPVRRIGWLSPAKGLTGMDNLSALRAGLREVGYVEGRNIAIEERWAEDRTERLPSLAAELVRRRVEVICTAGSQATAAAKQATPEIPVVFANVAFPLDQHLVASYARPGGNLTGVAFIGPEYGKRLELLREASPKLERVALIFNPENAGSVLAVKETQRWAAALKLTLEPHRLRGTSDLPVAFEAIARKLPDGLMTTADPLIVSHRVPIVEFVAKHRLLSIFPGKEFVDAGGLMFYGGSIPEMYRRAAIYVDKILKGARAGELPVEQPIKFDMVISLKTAKAFGLTIPASLQLRADQLLE